MLPWLGHLLTQYFGPFRLFTSYLFLASIGGAIGMLATWYLLPKVWQVLPHDNGRKHAVDGEGAKGKPVSGGAVFFTVWLVTCLLILPFNWRMAGILLCVFLATLEGHIDDMSKSRGKGGLSEYVLGAMDLVISLLAAMVLCGMQSMELWLPLLKESVMVGPWIYIPVATVILWMMINATNCTDGVDGLSASLSILAFIYLGGILYGIVGHTDISTYLLVPHYENGADWALLAFTMAGCLAGYLWHNALPSQVLMGDAGSRPIGLLMGILVMATGNPFLVFVVTGVVLANGATGLIKVALLRFFKISIFKNVRYPLHDHARQNLGWSNTQVLVRFVLIQAIVTPILLVLVFKVR